MTLLHPIWILPSRAPSRLTPDDATKALAEAKKAKEANEKIWEHLETYVKTKKGDDPAKTEERKKLLETFLQMEKGKESYFWKNDKTLQKVNTKVAIAPFPVPEKINSAEYTVVEGSYYNFRHRYRRFNAKVISVSDDGTVTFDKDSLTQQFSDGSFASKVDGCKVWENEALGFQDKNDKTKVEVKVDKKMVEILQNEVLRPYLQFRKYVDDLFRLSNDCRSEQRTMFIMEKIQRLFVEAPNLDLHNLPVRYNQLDLSQRSEAIRNEREKEKIIKQLKREGCTNETGEDLLSMSKEDLNELLKECRKKKKEYQQYNPLLIDKIRIELDATMWSKSEYGQHRRDDPSIYDLFDVLSIDRTWNLQKAVEETVKILRERKTKPKKKWEENFWYYADPDPRSARLDEPNTARITERDVVESALVNSMHYNSFQPYQDDIVRHLFRNPSLFESADVQQALETLKNKAIVSKDGQLPQMFAFLKRHDSDKINLLQLLNMPWPKTKHRLKRVNVRSRYYPSKFNEARLPESFYLKLKQEREACENLRHIFYMLQLSKKKGYPVIQKVSVVTPEAYGTDYRTTPLPRVEAPAGSASEFWSGNLNFKENSSKRRFNGEIKVLPVTSHPLYPSAVKANF